MAENKNRGTAVTNSQPADTPPPGGKGAAAGGHAGVDTRPRLPMPHDRDEAASEQGHPIEPVIEQAEKDLSSGQLDTDLRGAAAGNFDQKFGPRRKHGTP